MTHNTLITIPWVAGLSPISTSHSSVIAQTTREEDRMLLNQFMSVVSPTESSGGVLSTVWEIHPVLKPHPRLQLIKKKWLFQPLLLEGASLILNPLQAVR